MDGSIYLLIGIAAGFALAAFLLSSDPCCAALGKAAFGKYGIPDLGNGIDATAGGIIAGLGLA